MASTAQTGPAVVAAGQVWDTRCGNLWRVIEVLSGRRYVVELVSSSFRWDRVGMRCVWSGWLFPGSAVLVS